MDLLNNRVDDYIVEYQKEVEDQYNNYRIAINFFYILAAIGLKNSIPALSYYVVILVSSLAFILSILYWSIDSITIKGYWRYISSYLDILLLLLMVYSFGGLATWKTEAWALGFVWGALSIYKIDWKLTLSTILLWFIGLLLIYFNSYVNGLVQLGTITESQNLPVASWGNIYVDFLIVFLYTIAVTKITYEFYKLKVKEFSESYS